MQGDAVALAVENDGAESVGADRMLRLEDLAGVRFDRRDGFVEPPLRVQQLREIVMGDRRLRIEF